MITNIRRINTSLVVSLSTVLFWADPAFSQNSDFRLQMVGNGVWVAIATDTGRAGGNAGFVVGNDGIAIIDTFEDPEAARELLAAIRTISALPIRFVINTHYHLDHVNGNDVFANEGAVVVAHRNVHAWMRTENLKWWGDSIKPSDRARVQSLKLPDISYDDRIDLYLGERSLKVLFLRGHTGGDSVVLVPDAKVVYCGDLLWKDHIPNLVDASTKEWIQTLNALQKDDAQVIFLPGHGGIANSIDLTIFRDYLVGLRDSVRDSQHSGKSGESLLDAVLPTLRQKYGSWGFFNDFAKDNVLQTAQELSGHKRVPSPANDGGPR